MDSVNIVAQLIQNTVILSTAVELGIRWRELAEKTGKLSSAQIAGYEAPHRGKSGEVGPQVSLPANNGYIADTTDLMEFLMSCEYKLCISCSVSVNVEARL